MGVLPKWSSNVWRYVGDFLFKDGGLVLRMKTEVDLP